MERERYRRGKLLSQQANGLIIIRAVDFTRFRLTRHSEAIRRVVIRNFADSFVAFHLLSIPVGYVMANTYKTVAVFPCSRDYRTPVADCAYLRTEVYLCKCTQTRETNAR